MRKIATTSISYFRDNGELILDSKLRLKEIHCDTRPDGQTSRRHHPLKTHYLPEGCHSIPSHPYRHRVYIAWVHLLYPTTVYEEDLLRGM